MYGGFVNIRSNNSFSLKLSNQSLSKERIFVTLCFLIFLFATFNAFDEMSEIVIIEHGHTQGNRVKNYFQQKSFDNIKQHQDINQKIRVTSASKIKV